MEWSDGTETNYAAKYFEKKLALGNCTYLDTKGFWNVKNCSERLDGAICYKSASKLGSMGKYPTSVILPGIYNHLQSSLVLNNV